MALVATSTTMDISKMTVIKKEQKTKRRESQKPTTAPVTRKTEENKERVQSLKFLQLLANKVELRTTTMERRRKLQLLPRRSDVLKVLSKFE